MVVVAEVFRQTLLRIFAPLLGVGLAALALLLVFRSCRSGRGGRVPASQWVAICVVMVVCTLLSGKSTNGVNGVGGPHLTQFISPAVQSVTPEDISNGWRVAEETAAEPFAQPPSGVVTNERWRLRGAHDDAFHIPTNGWSYPFASGVTVFSLGEIRTDIRERDFPRAFEEDLSLLPLASRHLLPEGRQDSAFWHGATPSNTLVATWRNAALGRVATNVVSFQAELFSDGGFAYRYEDRTVRHVRVWPFDWDGDGLENTVDPEPLVAGPDAHGTNAEWYNVVCSNLFEAVEGGGDALAWRDGVNSNAYYFVDVVASDGPAPIYFAGDRASRLGDPVVVARGGETNHVPLLMGVEYTVTSTVPITVSVPDNADVSAAGVNDGPFFSVRWPLSFGIIVASGGGYEVEVMPFDPGGDFSWSEEGGGLNLRGGSGCTYSSVGNWIGFSCGAGGNCGCSGCSLAGTYSVESASFALPSVWCGCGAVGYGGTNEPPTAPFVSVSFDKTVVFYEDAYTNAPNDVVAKHSTNTTLAVFAYGGESGGMLYVSASNIGKLVRTGGRAMSFPYTAFVPPNGAVSFDVEYEAETHSDSAGDISVTASLLPSNGGSSVSDSASATAVKVQLESVISSVIGNNCSRHRYGVGEVVLCKWFPENIMLSWSCHGVGTIIPGVGGDFTRFSCPLTNTVMMLTATMDGVVSFSPTISIVEPTGFYCEKVRKMESALGENMAGDVGMILELYIEPRTVCFGNIAIEEVPTAEGLVGGYFQNTAFSEMWSHTRDNRAGQWKNVGNDNLFMLEDEAVIEGALPPMTPDGTLTNDFSFGWRDGAIIWTIPLGWNEHDTIGETEPIKTNAVPEQQMFTINSDGMVSVIKAGHFVCRGTNTQIRTGRIQR